MKRDRPGLTFWATILLALVLLVPLTFGPLCWAANRVRSLRPFVVTAYAPLIRVELSGPAPAAAALSWWAHMSCETDWEWGTDSSGGVHWMNFVDCTELEVD